MKLVLISIISILTVVLFQGCTGGSSVKSSSTVLKQYVYVANYGDNTISCFSVDSETGKLTLIETVSAGTGGSPSKLAVLDDKLFVIKENVSNIQSNVQIFTISKTTGALTPFQNLKAGNANQAEPAQSISISPDKKFVYIGTRAVNGGFDSLVSTYSISSLTGLLNFASSTTIFESARSLIDPTGKYLIWSTFTHDSLISYELNTSTGAVNNTPITAATITTPESIAITSNGEHIYAAFSLGVRLFDISPSGTLSAVNTITILTSIRDIALSPDGKYLAVLDSSNNSLITYIIDASLGAYTQVDSASTGNYPRSITFDLSGKYIYTVNEASTNISVYSISDGYLFPTETVFVGSTPYSVITAAF